MSTTKDDRELLELAARAAGLRVCWHEGDGDAARHMDLTEPPRIFWNPLADDGDALRLAVKLCMNVNVWGGGVAVLYSAVFSAVETVSEPAGSDLGAATRRAIVRAAASIGAEKEET